MTTAQDALAALAVHLGLPLAFADGICELRVDGQSVVARDDEARGRLVVSALVADDLPDAPSRAFVCDLLNLGFGVMEAGLPAVGRDPETGFIACFSVFPLATLSAAEFPEAFDKFATFAAALADRFEAERARAAGEAEGASSAGNGASAFNTDGFMQV